MVMIMERSSVWKSNVEISPNCPRCGCSNTKFCYYNNYSLTQPRYFCKGCRRYWTKGGSLRNVPVGGGCRKNRRGRSLRLSSAVAADGGLHLKNSGFGSTTTVDPIGHSYHGVNSSGSSTFLADHSARPSSGSHIDLALVYANFLNPKPDCKSGAISNIGPEIPELGRHDHHYFDPSLEFSTTSTPDHMTGEGSSIQILPQIPELSFENCCDGSEQIYFCGLDSFPKYHQDRSSHENCAITTDFVLPPLPGQELLWSSHQIMQAATQLAPAMIEPLDHLQTHHQDHDNLLSNWSPFDLPSDDTFPGGVHEKD